VQVGEIQRFEGGDWRPSRAVFVPDGKHILACGGGDGTIKQYPPELLTLRLFDRQTGKEVRRFSLGHTQGVRGLAISPDGKRALSSGADVTVRLWDVSTGGECLQVMPGHKGSVGLVAFTPDGTRGVSGGAQDGTTRLWDLSTGKQLPVSYQEHKPF